MAEALFKFAQDAIITGVAGGNAIAGGVAGATAPTGGASPSFPNQVATAAAGKPRNKKSAPKAGIPSVQAVPPPSSNPQIVQPQQAQGSTLPPFDLKTFLEDLIITAAQR